MSQLNQELALYDIGDGQWELLTEEEAMLRGLLNTERGLGKTMVKVTIGIATAAAIVGGGYLLYRYFNKKTGREEQEILTPEEAARKGLTNGQKIIVGAAAAAAATVGGYFLYRYFNPATGMPEQRMLKEGEARRLGLSDAQKVSQQQCNQGGELPPIVDAQYIQPEPHIMSPQQQGKETFYIPPQQSYGQIYGQSHTQSFSQPHSHSFSPTYYGQPPCDQRTSYTNQYPNIYASTTGQNSYYQQPMYGEQSHIQQPHGQSRYDSDLRKEFNKMDLNRSGYIDKEEIYLLAKGRVPKIIINMGMKFVDKDGNGKIDFDEYKRIRRSIPLW